MVVEGLDERGTALAPSQDPPPLFQIIPHTTS